MKRLSSASFFAAIIAVLCIMDAGVPIYGYQVILDPIRFTEMEMAGENLRMHSRKANKRLVPELSDSERFTNYNPWPNSRKRRSPFPLASPFAYPYALAMPEPAPMPIMKKYGHLRSPSGYSFHGDSSDDRQSQSYLHSPQDWSDSL